LAPAREAFLVWLAVLAAKIINVLDDRKLSVRAAEKQTGVAASEFSRIRNAKLGRFTLVFEQPAVSGSWHIHDVGD